MIKPGTEEGGIGLTSSTEERWEDGRTSSLPSTEQCIPRSCRSALMFVFIVYLYYLLGYHSFSVFMLSVKVRINFMVYRQGQIGLLIYQLGNLVSCLYLGVSKTVPSWWGYARRSFPRSLREGVSRVANVPHVSRSRSNWLDQGHQ